MLLRARAREVSHLAVKRNPLRFAVPQGRSGGSAPCTQQCDGRVCRAATGQLRCSSVATTSWLDVCAVPLSLCCLLPPAPPHSRGLPAGTHVRQHHLPQQCHALGGGRGSSRHPHPQQQHTGTSPDELGVGGSHELAVHQCSRLQHSSQPHSAQWLQLHESQHGRCGYQERCAAARNG